MTFPEDIELRIQRAEDDPGIEEKIANLIEMFDALLKRNPNLPMKLHEHLNMCGIENDWDKLASKE